MKRFFANSYSLLLWIVFILVKTAYEHLYTKLVLEEVFSKFSPYILEEMQMVMETGEDPRPYHWYNSEASDFFEGAKYYHDAPRAKESVTIALSRYLEKSRVALSQKLKESQRQ